MSTTEKVVVGCYLQLDKQPRQNGKTLPCARLMDENDKLRELVVRMSRALDIDGDWCHRDCCEEFRCTGSCAIADKLVELGIAEVVE